MIGNTGDQMAKSRVSPKTGGRKPALNKSTADAGKAYQDFFGLWKDADPDIPILKEAKAEYAKLR
jgi:hypothetical protein